MTSRPGLGSCAVLALALVACGRQGAPAPAPGPASETRAAVPPATESDSPSGPESPAAVPVPPPLERIEVQVYFPSADDDVLRTESREIFDTSSPVERAKQILSDLIAGPSGAGALPALPPGTRLRQVFVLPSGVAYADFSEELRDGMAGGSQNEMLAVYAIVNSLVLNVPEISRVGILVNGRPCDTLNGHLDLRRPLPADASFTERPAQDTGEVI